MRYPLVCFDFDYTLADATGPILAGFRHGFRTLGHPEPTEQAVQDTIGLMLEDAYTLLTGERDPARIARFRPLFLEVARPLQIAETQLLPGAQALLKGLRHQGVRLGIVSTKLASTIRLILAERGLPDLVDFVLGSEDVRRHKPDPEGLLLALSREGFSPRQMLYCGDTVLDAGAAQGAGADFCPVLGGVTTAQAFEPYPRVFLAHDLWELGDFLEVPRL